MKTKTKLITGPSTEVLTLTEIKSHLRISSTGTEENSLLGIYRKAARQYVEEVTDRKMLTQTWDYYLDDWPNSYRNSDYESIRFPYSPLQSIPSTGVEYTDSNSNTTTFSSTAWSEDIITEPGRLVIGNDDDWPSVTLNNNNPIRMRFICGYTSDEGIPSPIKSAMLLIIGHLHENREDVVLAQGLAGIKLPFGVDTLLAPFRVY